VIFDKFEDQDVAKNLPANLTHLIIKANANSPATLTALEHLHNVEKLVLCDFQSLAEILNLIPHFASKVTSVSIECKENSELQIAINNSLYNQEAATSIKNQIKAQLVQYDKYEVLLAVNGNSKLEDTAVSLHVRLPRPKIRENSTNTAPPQPAINFSNRATAASSPAPGQVERKVANLTLAGTPPL